MRKGGGRGKEGEEEVRVAWDLAQSFCSRARCQCFSFAAAISVKQSWLGRRSKDRGSRLSRFRVPSSSPQPDAARKTGAFEPREGSGARRGAASASPFPFEPPHHPPCFLFPIILPLRIFAILPDRILPLRSLSVSYTSFLLLLLSCLLLPLLWLFGPSPRSARSSRSGISSSDPAASRRAC